MNASHQQAMPAAPEAKLRATPHLPDHELIRRIGSGAYGEVWLARNVLGTCRAVKVVYRDSFHESRPYEREYRGIQKFEPISRSNDGFVDILQIGRSDERGHFYYVMELADDLEAEREVKTRGANGTAGAASEDRAWTGYCAKTLRSELQNRGRLPLEECLPIAMSLTLALAHLHRHGLIHRDIKPSNIIFVGGVPKLADIGLVTDADEARSFVGTEGFIPPEGPNSPQADIYSFGKVLYEMSMGKDRLDFPEPFTALGRPGAEGLDELNAVILKACAPNPRDRYQTAEELHVDLALVQDGRSVKLRHAIEKRLAFARKAGAIVGLVAALATAGYLYQRHQTREAKRLQTVAEDLVARMQIQNAESLFERGNSSLAMAHLAHVLRNHPDNRVAAERILAALAQRNFPRPEGAPLVHQAKLSLPAHRSAARLSPDGGRVLTVCEDHTVHIWNVETRLEMVPAHRHQGPVLSAEFSPDGEQIVTASADGTACILEAHTGAVVFEPLRHDGPVTAATFSPDGNWVATASSNSTVRLFNPRTGQPGLPPWITEGPVQSVSFSADSQLLAAGTETGQAYVWGVKSGGKVQRFSPGQPVRLVRLSPEGKWLAGAIFGTDENRGWQLHIWNVATGTPVTVSNLERIYSLEFSPDSRRILTASGSNLAQVWRVDSGQELLQLRHRSIVYSARFSPDGGRILTASVDHTARLWDALTGVAVTEAMLHDGRVIHAEFSRSGTHVLTAGWEDKTVKLWDVRAGSPPNETTLPHRTWVLSAEFGKDEQHVLTATGGVVPTAAVINTWALERQQFVTAWESVTSETNVASALPAGMEAVTAQFTRSGSRALISARENRQEFSTAAWVWDVEKGITIGPELHFQQRITCAHFSPDGTQVAIACSDGTAAIWDARLGVALAPPMAHGGQLRSVRFSPDGRLLVTCGSQGTAIIWNTSTGHRVSDPLRHDAAVWFAQFSPKGDKLVTASLDYTARIWSTNAALVATLHHRAPVEYAEFSPDGTLVATASGDSARLWSALAGKQTTEPLQHAEHVMTIRFSPDGLRVVTASMDGTAQVWDVATGLKLTEPFRHSNWVVSATFSPNGSAVVTASLDKTARVWGVPSLSGPIPSWLPELAEAVAGERLDESRIPRLVPWSQYATSGQTNGRIRLTSQHGFR